ncbi:MULTISPECIES: ABC transporter permease [Leuconostoc]|jgi:peptide/nickel transport system permease protein|uniref:ABC transporter permease n=1 Tax=Leuconostoc TaxID=1243 RepID=UPI0011DCB868|nr:MULTISPECIES: ABC transporter permease [Leuconostoc]MBK0040372.1 ABC transporter permease [Leuconostoc sp. S51]MBK0051278.1 ABC transporter permease [Leuconostoc sp. S50]MBS0958417.1 ABC transporter permease [Leuconostoc pseudomesenteroides]MCT4381616.1 ABC transporter permease [Leuconostoc pseudomesenteroides]MCT4413318.1 ABC transporter permease [Leuconostoc pseudomesenteroides]
MWRTILRRVLIMIPQLFLVSILIFMLAQLMPGDPFYGNLNPNSDPATIARMRHAAGLDQPLYQQYIHWIDRVFHGDLGTSYAVNKGWTVTRIIASRLWPTISMGIIAAILTYVFAISEALLSARHENKTIDRILMVWNTITSAVPSFVFYFLMMILFVYLIPIFPASGTGIDDSQTVMTSFFSNLRYAFLPALTIALFSTNSIFQYLRSNLLDQQAQDYVRTARAKGVTIKDVFRKHILRNAFLPIASGIGYSITGVLGGAMFAETIFGYPGIGALFVQALTSRDYTVITAVMLLQGFLALLGGLLSDVISAWVDPRIRVK